MNEIEQDVMDARKWIEFGKMFNNMIQENWEVLLDSVDTTENGIRFAVSITTEDDHFDEFEYYSTPYAAIKSMYFKYYLEQEFDDITITFPPDVEAELYRLSDIDGITVDEQITKILCLAFPPKEDYDQYEEQISPCGDECCCGKDNTESTYAQAKCCNICAYFSLSNYWCKYNDHPAGREYVCSDFKSK